MDKKNDNKSFAVLFITPFIVLLICMSILLIASIKPYNKLSVYLNLAFMDEFKKNPNESEGLNIIDNEIELDHNGKTYDKGEVIRPSFGEQFAVLRCEAADITAPVYWGSIRELFKKGACQASYSKLSGLEGKTVISAHEDTFFNNLSKMKVGDEVVINTNYGEFTYKVKELVTFKKTDKRYVNPSDETSLVLYTCKKDILGASDDRIGVICEPVESKFYVKASEEAAK